MTILLDSRRNVEAIDADPTALDREHAAMASPFADEHHTDEPTPADALACTLDDEDMGDWWNTLPYDADLDARWSLTVAGGRSSGTRIDPAEEAARWGRGDDRLIDCLGRCEYPG